jgi:hypothetical protein
MDGSRPGNSSSAGAVAATLAIGYDSSDGRAEETCRRRPHRTQRRSSSSFHDLQYVHCMGWLFSLRSRYLLD